MDAAALIDLYRQRFDDKAVPYHLSDDEALGFLAEAEEEACLRSRLIFDKTSAFCRLSLVAGRSVYPLNDRIFGIRDAFVTDANGYVTQLTGTDATELDRISSTWRQDADTPKYFIHYDKHIELTPVPTATMALSLEVFRLPLQQISNLADKPEIHQQHHRNLVLWVLHRAYATQDADMGQANKAAEYEARFATVFGARPRADAVRARYTNRPHHNKAHL